MKTAKLTNQLATTHSDALKLRLYSIHVPEKAPEQLSCFWGIRGKVPPCHHGVHMQLFKAREQPHIFSLIAFDGD